MNHSKWWAILTLLGIGGGLLLTLLSRLYAVYEPIIDAEEMHFGLISIAATFTALTTKTDSLA